MRINYKNSSTKSFFLISILWIIAGLSACSGGGGDETPAVNTDPKGYYTGAADLKDADNLDLHVDDLQGMVSDSRFMFMSVANTLLYDGMISDLTDGVFTADVTIYKDGVATDTTTVSGMITVGSQITGTFEGTVGFNGTFTLVYDQSNSEASALSKVENAPEEYWRGRIGPQTDQFFEIDNVGNVINFDEPSDGPFASCTIDTGSTVSVIPNTRLYNVVIEFLSCDAPGSVYTGFATTRSISSTDDVLVFTFTDGDFSASAEYTHFTFPQ